jgi:hypothetical protein
MFSKNNYDWKLTMQIKYSLQWNIENQNQKNDFN